MGLGCFDKKLAAEVPNRYNLTPQSIKRLVIKNWDALKKRTWHNEAMRDTGSWWCHLEGCGKRGGSYDDSDEFWIGFREEDDSIDCNFTCYEGMCKYLFTSFYKYSARKPTLSLDRGMNGRTFNADVNGALNIIRKSSVVDMNILYGRGEVDTPVRIRIA